MGIMGGGNGEKELGEGGAGPGDRECVEEEEVNDRGSICVCITVSRTLM